MGFFDQNGDGYVDFDEFLFGLRGRPNTKRQAVIDDAFAKFDRNNYGVISIYDLKLFKN